MRPGSLINKGSVEDVRCTLKHSVFSSAELLKEYAMERINRNRDTVKKMIIAKLDKSKFKKEYGDAVNSANAKCAGVYDLGSFRTNTIKYFIGTREEWDELASELWKREEVNHG